jgi:MATE family multidrug resistance protein
VPTPAQPPAESDFARRFARLSIYNVLSNVTVPLAALVDTALLGHLPDIRFLAGVALAAVLFEYVYWTFGFLRMGTTGLTAQAAGRNDRSETYLVLYRSLVLGLGCGLLILLCKGPLESAGFALLANPSPEVQAAGRDYFGARIWGAPAVLANFAFLGWFLGREDGRSVLAMTLVANVANIGLDWLFIIRLGKAAAGAGAATALSQYLMTAVAVALMLRRGRPLPFAWREVADPRRLRELVALNRDILIRTVALITTFALFTNFSAVLGTVTLAANAILSRVQMLAAYLIDGCAFATESFAGRFWAAGEKQRLERLRRLALASGLVLSLPFSAGLLLAPRPLLGLLTSHGPTLDAAVRYSWWLAPILSFGAIAYIYDGLFIGLTAGRTLRNTMMISTLVGFVPLALLALARGNNHLLWSAMLGYMVVRTVTLDLAYRRTV